MFQNVQAIYVVTRYSLEYAFISAFQFPPVLPIPVIDRSMLLSIYYFS